MHGLNLKRGVTKGDGNILEVQEIFKTLQGEGPFVGEPAIFVRLGGCNLACKFCDTEFENFKSWSIEKIVEKINMLSYNSSNKQIIKLIVITGGEPLRQPIEKLCNELIKLNYTIQIETNGTLYRRLPKEVFIICSPKAEKIGYSLIRADLLPHISAIKFLIAKNNHKYNSIIDVGQLKHNIPVFIQPMDEGNEEVNNTNIAYAIELALKNGYRLSLQTHKILGIE